MFLINIEKENIKIEVEYQNEEELWNNLIRYIVSFIVDSNAVKEALEDTNGEFNK